MEESDWDWVDGSQQRVWSGMILEKVNTAEHHLLG